MYLNNNTKMEILQDKNKKNKINDWKGKKERNMRLAQLYQNLYKMTGNSEYKKWANKIGMCALQLVFQSENETGDNKKLYQMYTCKNKFCPICQWRRSKKIGYQINKIIEWLDINKKGCEYIFGTLTLKNCSARELKNTIDKIYVAMKRFKNDRSIKMAYKGLFRALEITFNKKSKMYHPHIHFIAVVHSGAYFDHSNKNYISQKKLCEIWKRCLDLDYIPLCSLEKIKQKYKAVCEVAKYSVKSKDILDETILDTLDSVLYKRRLYSYTGWFKEAYQKMRLDKNENDLVHIENEKEKVSVGSWLLTYKWSIGLKNYVLVDRTQK